MEEVRAFAGAVMDNVERIIVGKRATIELVSNTRALFPCRKHNSTAFCFACRSATLR